jgi:hypothetical protein
MSFSRLLAVLLCLAYAAASPVRAAVVLPTGLAPGAQYQIAFVTAHTTTATNSDINYYNNFVTTEANQDSILAGLGVSWKAIASTATVRAYDNAPSNGSIPVYNLAGQLVEGVGTSLYNTNMGPYPHTANLILNPIDYDQYGEQYGVNEGAAVWTGSTVGGNIYPNDYYNGIPGYLGSSFVHAGVSTATAGYWIDGGIATWSTDLLPLYALSSPITVTTPEPSTIALLLTASLGGLLWWRRRK